MTIDDSQFQNIYKCSITAVHLLPVNKTDKARSAPRRAKPRSLSLIKVSPWGHTEGFTWTWMTFCCHANLEGEDQKSYHWSYAITTLFCAFFTLNSQDSFTKSHGWLLATWPGSRTFQVIARRDAANSAGHRLLRSAWSHCFSKNVT